ncbi:MAG: peptidylprolyl isomerase [Oscillospiraceae bacterium]|jgi:parvulin-like peptidyl-prolyl isomerase|nr:peptidylprolyl isomerase [Oscillospiraceae bacterium]
MSASNKKQQRKAALADGMTQKQRQEQLQAETAKRQKTIYTAVGVVCAVAAAGLLIWNGMNSWKTKGRLNDEAATIGGQVYTVADLQYYYSSLRNTYVSYGIIDATLDEGAQWYDEGENKTFADYFRDSALSNLQQTAVLCAAAKEEGYTLSEEAQQSIDSQLAQIDIIRSQWGMSRKSYFLSQHGISEEVFMRNLTNDILASEYANHNKASYTYDEAALNEYYAEHSDTLDSYDYRYFFISGSAPTTDADGNTITPTDEDKAAAMETAKQNADDAVAAIQASENREAAFAAEAPKYVSESTKEAYAADPDHSLATGVMGETLNRNSSVYAEWLMDGARKSGDVTAIQSGSSGYYVVMFLDRYLDKSNSVNIRHILIMADTSDSTETDSNGSPVPTQTAMDAAKTEAEALLAQWESGDKTAESFGTLAQEHSDDPGSKDKGGQYTRVPQGQMFEGFDQWIFDPTREEGDTGLVENPQSGQQGWHVIYFEGTDGYWEEVATQAKQNSEQNEWLTSLTDAAEAVALDAMRYVGAPNTAVASTPAPSESPAGSEAAE